MIELIRGQFENIDIPRHIDMILMDPPDNVGLEYDSYDDNLPDGEYQYLLERWLRKAVSLTSGPVWITFNEKWIGTIENILSSCNIRLIQRCWWHWTFGQACKTRYTPSIRPIYWLNNNTIFSSQIRIPSARQTKYNDKRAKSGGKLPDNVWEFSRVCGTFNERRRWHVCQIPEGLMERVILGHTLPGATILDPFIGSGTTAIVANRLARNCIGIDQSQVYLDKIRTEIDKNGR
jgi:DNA modification methylase